MANARSSTAPALSIQQVHTVLPHPNPSASCLLLLSSSSCRHPRFSSRTILCLLSAGQLTLFTNLIQHTPRPSDFSPSFPAFVQTQPTNPLVVYANRRNQGGPNHPLIFLGLSDLERANRAPLNLAHHVSFLKERRRRPRTNIEEANTEFDLLIT